MLEPDVINHIRTIFLHHESRVTVADAADLLGRSRAEMNAAIRGAPARAARQRREEGRTWRVRRVYPDAAVPLGPCCAGRAA